MSWVLFAVHGFVTGLVLAASPLPGWWIVGVGAWIWATFFFLHSQDTYS